MVKDWHLVNWPLVRPTIFFTLSVLFLTLVGQLVFSKITDPRNSAGCPALSYNALDPSETVAVWDGRQIIPPHSLLASVSVSGVPESSVVLGARSDSKWIEVNLKTQKLIAHDGPRIFLETPISSGLWNRTPTGEYYIWLKAVSTKMEGGSRLNNTYYYLPNVPYAMYFYGDYGIHGTYWHNNFGVPMSHGCVNTPTSIAEKLFYWTGPAVSDKAGWVKSTAANPGTKIIIHD